MCARFEKINEEIEKFLSDLLAAESMISEEFPKVVLKIRGHFEKILSAEKTPPPWEIARTLREIKREIKKEAPEDIWEIIQMMRNDFLKLIHTFGNCRLFYALGDYFSNPNDETRANLLRLLNPPEKPKNPENKIDEILDALRHRDFVFDENHARKNIGGFLRKSHFRPKRILKAITQKPQKCKNRSEMRTIEIANSDGLSPRVLFWRNVFLGIYEHKKYEKILLAVKGKKGDEEKRILAQITGIPLCFLKKL